MSMSNHQIEEKWKIDLSMLAIKYGTGTEIRGRCEIYEIKELTAFIENLLEQERQRMSDEIDELHPTTDSNEARRGYDQARADILSIINK